MRREGRHEERKHCSPSLWKFGYQRSSLMTLLVVKPDRIRARLSLLRENRVFSQAFHRQ